jgi:hypothetical protein
MTRSVERQPESVSTDLVAAPEALPPYTPGFSENSMSEASRIHHVLRTSR